MQIHQTQLAFEFRLPDIPKNSPPDRALPWTCADERDRTGPKQIF
jgi:hypothetical protein